MNYTFTKIETEKIVGHFGQRFYEKMLDDLRFYTQKWQLEIIEVVDYFSVNCIFICTSKTLGEVVLKIGNPEDSVLAEAQTLKEYDGRRLCRLFDFDTVRGGILEECIRPGTRLREEKSLEKRLSVFSELFNGLHIAPRDVTVYPTYFDWVSRITNYMQKESEHRTLYLLMEKAKSICSSLCKKYPQKLLLHGDLHHDNLLRGTDNHYKIIDPKGVVGDPIFDIPRFILNEFYDAETLSYDFYKTHVEKVAKILEKSLFIPEDTIKKCVFIETALANCWNVESREPPDLEAVLYAEAVMGNMR